MNEFHKPFIKSLVLIAIVTVFAMVSSRYLISFHSDIHYKTLEYSSQKSQFGTVYGKE
jgi:multisubunit Na+/H+ antiporter MnhC subunit